MPVINGPFRVFGRTLSHFANNFVLLMKNSELDDNYWLAWWCRWHVDNSKYLRDSIDLVVTAFQLPIHLLSNPPRPLSHSRYH